MQREFFGTRLGFLLVSAGCAVGLGNIWRFPWLVGTYGGGLFVMIFLIFIALLGLPVMASEFAIGRGSGKSLGRAFQELQPKGSKWHLFGYFGMAGNYMLMFFYTSVVGWVCVYFYRAITGSFMHMNPEEITSLFTQGTEGDPLITTGWMLVVTVIGLAVCVLGLQSGVEKFTKFMMSGFYVLLVIIIIRALTLPQMPGVETSALDGLRFFLTPDMSVFDRHHIVEVIFRAMGQAFFSLSLGMGSMLIFGSYCGKDKSLPGESRSVIGLDLVASFGCALIIFPACFAFGISPGAGPGLLFITLPNIFTAMPMGQAFAVVFFLFLIFATITTVIAVFENIVAFGMDIKGWARKKSVIINLCILLAGSIPTSLGFNVWFNVFSPLVSWLGPTANLLTLFDFIISQNILPLGSAIIILFCALKKGWGYENFVAEVNTGEGMKWTKSKGFQVYYTWAIPGLVAFIFICGYLARFTGIFG